MMTAIIAMMIIATPAATPPISSHGTCALGSMLGPTVFVGSVELESGEGCVLVCIGVGNNWIEINDEESWLQE